MDGDASDTSCDIGHMCCGSCGVRANSVAKVGWKVVDVEVSAGKIPPRGSKVNSCVWVSNAPKSLECIPGGKSTDKRFPMGSVGVFF